MANPQDSSINLPIKSAAGPPVARAPPEPMNKPVPIAPPMAIICKCLFFKLACNGDLAVAAMAFSKSLKSPLCVISSSSTCLKESTNLPHAVVGTGSRTGTMYSPFSTSEEEAIFSGFLVSLDIL
ncbi:hypothetical protein WICPIJ_006424 [Wickerhamomyces pijperi]|uniref:Uncharacterized protein n=1 Tax=Wickerhamomyces pijperi TaxID=599730 RepID=A0A9P8Q411_WICPI|nr:hypothetical protein WICPIJ_006424 [Wickerhamomyces pijperi]